MSVALRPLKMDESRAWPIIHPTADVSPSAHIGPGTVIWHRAHVREYAHIGPNSVIGKDVYVDLEVHIGCNVRILNSAQIYLGAVIDDSVYIGSHVCIANERNPRSIYSNGTLKPVDTSPVERTKIHLGATINSHAIIIAGLVIGKFAMVESGAFVVHDVPDHGLVEGNPAQLVGFVCACGRRLTVKGTTGHCPACESSVQGLGPLP